MRDEHNHKKRAALWDKVKKVVELNSNVRTGQREDRNGEISRVWEWVGNVAALDEGVGAGRRRKSGRVSWGVYDETSSPVSGSDGGWKEGRPIY